MYVVGIIITTVTLVLVFVFKIAFIPFAFIRSAFFNDPAGFKNHMKTSFQIKDLPKDAYQIDVLWQWLIKRAYSGLWQWLVHA